VVGSSQERRKPRDDDSPLGPDTNIPIHSHPYHEMFYVLEGEIEIGGVTYTAGSCIYIEKDTPYGPTRAPKGGKVLRYAEAAPGK
jgi:mannose-6-phosphate isomerase-like protein (cupin superfamily)